MEITVVDIIPLIIPYPQRPDKVVIQITLPSTVFHHGTHRIKRLFSTLYPTYPLTDHIYTPEQPASHAFGKDKLIVRCRHIFERTGKYTAPKGCYHIRRSCKPLRIKSRFRTIRQAKKFPTTLRTVSTHRHILA